MHAPRILLQLDADPHPSTFDAIVALDAGVDQLLRHGGVRESDVAALVQGAIFTRGVDRLAQTAIFIGGSKVDQGELLLRAVRDAFIGPLRVSVCMDTAGANTTAAAAVLCAARHRSIAGARALVLGATGPVGQRVARMLLQAGAQVVVTSRDTHRAESLRQSLIASLGSSVEERIQVICVSEGDNSAWSRIPADVVFATGAAGVPLANLADWPADRQLDVVVDVNAIPPVGIQGVEPSDRGVTRGRTICYGALGVGHWKMKLHRELIRRLFTRNDLQFDADEIFQVGRKLFDAEIHPT